MRRELPVMPATVRCSVYPGSGPNRRQCVSLAEVHMVAPDGEPVPGGWMCRPCGERIAAEYRSKLGEEWTLEPIRRAP